MTVTIKDQIDRIQYLLQDRDTEAFSRNAILVQHQEEIARLSRRQLWGEILWIQGVATTAQYSLPTSTVSVRMVLYNEEHLDFATEEMLDRLMPGWEDVQDEPRWWTTDGQSPNVIRIVPAPLRDGSAVPLIPPLPMILDPVNNILVFLYEDRSERADDESDTFPLPDAWEDVEAYETAAAMASKEGDYQQLPLAMALRELGKIYRNALGIA